MSINPNSQQQKDIFKAFYTGNGTAAGSLGSDITAVEWLKDSLNSLFNFAPDDWKSTGKTQYRWIAFKNIDSTLISFKTSIVQRLISSNPFVKYSIGIGNAGINQSEPSLVDEFTAPSLVTFSEITTVPTVANLGKLGPNDYIMVCIKREILPNFTEDPDVKSIIEIIGDSEGSDPTTPPPTPGSCPPDQKWDPISETCVDKDTVINCGAGKHYDEVLQQCVDDTNPFPTPVDMIIGIGGDSDCKTATDDGILNIKEERPDKFIQLGDASYGSSQQCYIEKMDKLKDIDLTEGDIIQLIGNHDDTEDGSAKKRTELFNKYPLLGASKTGWYSVTWSTIRIIAMDTQSSYGVGSAQHSFVVSELQKASQDGQIKFIIVAFHKPMYSADSSHSGLSDLRQVYQPLFDQYNVDLAICGHYHNFQRTYPIKDNGGSSTPTLVNGTAGPYNNVDGTIHIIIGTLGKALRGFSGSIQSWMKARAEEYLVGYMYLSNNGKTLTFKAKANTGETLDEFILNK